ncbi:hypothetical protein ABB37_07699 [Leptomonas pyrrhocoris]|uniref:Uncharacterized protein n=1 Tax=Leptomonas pyrrhocoris TaxID=157538 RepID=A0A0N0VDY5_LEPPY|nr:hypothetical protein ABB37_07699 [Leptomonas pyrrhocoris]KPA76351.1 hypothetical protein ABB37_07699 [Leptomonas pyrrhocoris]|eukprot:XP_015654790.1 hypothetical protein ABB37_07699 [Leptomonas pyrrhocoris]
MHSHTGTFPSSLSQPYGMMNAGTPPAPPFLSASALKGGVPPPPVLHLPNDAPPPEEMLRQLLLEWYSSVAELLIGEVAAADVLGYKNTPQLRACELKSYCAGTESRKKEKEIGKGEGGGGRGLDEVAGSASRPSAPASECEALLHSPHFPVAALTSMIGGSQRGRLTEKLSAKLTQLLPSLRLDSCPLPQDTPRGCGGVSPHNPQLRPTRPQPFSQRTLAMPRFDEREEFMPITNGPSSPTTSTPTAASHPSPSLPGTTASTLSPTTIAIAATTTPPTPTPWWYSLVDAVNSTLDSFDVLVDAVFSASPSTTPVPTLWTAFSSAQWLAGTGAWRSKEAAVVDTHDGDDSGEESCIMAGMLLNRHVHVRRGPAFSTVTSPLLVVLDLDLTVLRYPLSSLSFRAVQSMSPRELRALFVDVDFFRGFCEAVTRRGHELAICSLTEGAADQHWCELSVPEVVLLLLSAVLPPTRTYLTSPDDTVCLPKSIAGPGKLFHLQVLQERRNARDTSPAAAVAVAAAAAAEEHNDANGASLSCSSHEALDSVACRYASPAPLLLPRWLSTDAVLIDDDKENCWLAVTQGYHAAHCAETGLSASWFAARPDLQVLLGVTADEIPCGGPV